MNQEKIFYVSGMHCASCEILIEKKILEIAGVKSVEASLSKGEVLIEYDGQKPRINYLNKLFSREGYKFFENRPADATWNASFQAEEKDDNGSVFLTVASIFIALALILFASGKLDWIKFIQVNAKSSLPAFFVLGVAAGLSSCAALVGGIILSMSKQWLSAYPNSASFGRKAEPHIFFNIGRIIFYAGFGALLGFFGGALRFSAGFSAVLVITISAVMIILSLQMLGVKKFKKFQIAMPRFITRKAVNLSENNRSQNRAFPFVIGAATFFLPCGFTVAAQSAALLSGNALQGSLILFLFALGTAPTLLLIGLSSVKFSEKPHWSASFGKIAGILVLLFAIYNINNQMNVLGWRSLGSLFEASGNSTVENNLPPIVDGKQIIKMEANAYGYSPNYFKVKAGIPVRWEITDNGAGGCANAVIARGLFEGQISLSLNQTSIKEFTPTKIGRYKFTCWMGMISGIIEVIE